MAERENMTSPLLIHSFTVDGIRYDIVKTSTSHHYFVLNKYCNATKVCRIVGVESTIFEKKEMQFESTQPLSYFWELTDRVAIRNAIAYLEKKYEVEAQ